jgi:hypothetical protein
MLNHTPHIMESRLEPSRLVDPISPIIIDPLYFLVDLNYRVCSTRQVPPQRYEWWAEAVSEFFLERGLSQDMSSEVTSRAGSCLRSLTRRKHRLQMRKEHHRMIAVVRAHKKFEILFAVTKVPFGRGWELDYGFALRRDVGKGE